MGSKTLVIGDIHLQVLNHIPRYGESQIDAIVNIVKAELGGLTDIIFLGDIFVRRKPDPSTLVLFRSLLKRLLNITYHVRIHILMGNHDAESKADNGITALSLYEDMVADTEGLDPGYVIIYTKPTLWYTFHFIPHFENEDIIRNYIKDEVTADEWIFGHFGFEGCLNAQGIYDFSLDPKLLKGNVVLGHIHRYAVKDNITILGTPYSTSFNEHNKPHYYGVIYDSMPPMEIKKQIYGGPRHIVTTLDKLPDLNLEDKDKYCTMIRILLNPLKDGNQLELISTVIKEYGVDWVDVKFLSVIDTHDELSNYVPSTNIFTINESVIKDYVKQSRTDIPYDSLMEGLKEIED